MCPWSVLLFHVLSKVTRSSGMPKSGASHSWTWLDTPSILSALTLDLNVQFESLATNTSPIPIGLSKNLRHEKSATNLRHGKVNNTKPMINYIMSRSQSKKHGKKEEGVEWKGTDTCEWILHSLSPRVFRHIAAVWDSFNYLFKVCFKWCCEFIFSSDRCLPIEPQQLHHVSSAFQSGLFNWGLKVDITLKWNVDV